MLLCGLTLASGSKHRRETEETQDALDSLLIYAVWERDIALVNSTLSAGADPNVIMVSTSGATALHLAVQHSYVDLVEVLIAASADVDMVRTMDGSTALYFAAQNGHAKIVEKLIAASADVDKSRRSDGTTPLLIAAEIGHAKIVEKLIAAGADCRESTPARRGQVDPRLEELNTARGGTDHEPRCHHRPAPEALGDRALMSKHRGKH